MLTGHPVQKPPFTLAVRQALQNINNSAIEADLLFLEAWEMRPSMNLGLTLRASQIRRANPDLAAAINAELKGGPSGPIKGHRPLPSRATKAADGEPVLATPAIRQPGD